MIRLNSNGSFDSTFNTGTGANTTIFTIAEQTDGKILIGGNFTSFDGVPAIRVARLNSTGGLDTSFILAAGASGSVRNIVETSSGKVLIAGLFGIFNGVTQKGLIQLNTDGSVDSSFQIGSGPDGLVNSLAIQNDGKLIIGGKFQSFNQVGRNNIARIQTTESSLSRLENESHSITVFPNPTTGIISISNSENVAIDKIEIFDSNGRTVYQTKVENLNNRSMDISMLQNGIYILNISGVSFNCSNKIIKK